MMSEHKNNLLSIIHSVKKQHYLFIFSLSTHPVSLLPSSQKHAHIILWSHLSVHKLCGWGCTTVEIDAQGQKKKGRQTMNQFRGPKTSIMQGRYGK